MVNLTILAGGYTSFIATYIFNTDTSALTLASTSQSGNSPSWITLHPSNKSVLYAVNEVTPGALQSFAIDGNGALSTPLQTIDSGGDGPAFAAPLNTGQVAIMNYGGGNGKIIPTTDPLHFTASSAAPVIEFPAPVSHPHMALQHGSEVLVPDLGADKVWRLVEDGAPGEWRIQGFIEQPAGSGPRHIAVQRDTLFTLHETSSTLTSQPIPAAPNGTSSVISSLSITPPDPPEGAAFAAAEILYPTTDYAFPDRFIYVSNRNIGNPDPRGDTIAIFSATDSGELSLVTHVFTGLQQIRGMQLGGPDLRFLIAGGSASGGIAVFERLGDGGNLTLVARNEDLPTRTSFVWLD